MAKDFQCALCGLQYTEASSVYRHWQQHHSQQTGGQRHNPNWVVWVGAGPPPIPLFGVVGQPPLGALPAVAGPAAAPAIVPPPSPVAPPALPVSNYLVSGVGLWSPSQLRTSRTTRNQDHTPRNRAGIADFDPTEGLPVRRWEQQTIKVNQDASTDPAESNDRANDQDSDFPWPEQPLPTFISQLTPHNQELIRRSRMGNTSAKLSTWDAKTNSYIPGIELERREAARKAALNKSKHTSSTLNLIPDETNQPHSDDDDKQDDDAEDLLDADGLPEKRRKTTSGSNERIIEVKKWVPVPSAVAEKMPEPKYLADRRPGMESLYKGAYKATNGFGTLGDMTNAAMNGGSTGYDLGEAPAGAPAAGNGSNTNGGGLGQAQLDGASTPVRRNIPPRRKKKGGPGRRPKNWKPPTDPNAPSNSGNTNTETTTGAMTGEGETDTHMNDTPAASGERIDTTNNGPAVQGEADNGEGEGDGDGEGSGSESEGEGSEEGEIAPANDVPEVEVAAEVAMEPVVAEPERAPVQTEEVMEVVEEVVAVVESVDVGEVVETKEDVAANVEMDVLGALEAAVDKEAGESV